MDDLSGRTALVTGSTRDGMGRSIALTLANRGADTILNYGTHLKEETAGIGKDVQQAVIPVVPEQLGLESISMAGHLSSPHRQVPNKN